MKQSWCNLMYARTPKGPYPRPMKSQIKKGGKSFTNVTRTLCVNGTDWDWVCLDVHHLKLKWYACFPSYVSSTQGIAIYCNIYIYIIFILYALNLRNLRVQSVIPGTCHKFPMLRSGHLSSSRERLQSQAGGAERSGSEGRRFFAEMCCRNM